MMSLQMNRPVPAHKRGAAHARGFSLIELLVVIFIIALVIGITIPAVSRVRASARKTEATATMTTVGQAISTFSTDNKRLPGYFSQAEMGANANATTRRFGNMQNVLLDLVGGVIAAGSEPQPTGAILVGPSTNNAQNVWVNPSLVGVAQKGKGYLSLNERIYVRNKTLTGAAEHAQWGDIEDPFGMPILAWARNEASSQPIATANDFAQMTVGAAAVPPARFYWAGNARYLTAGVDVGTATRDQADASNLNSALGAPIRQNTMMTLLGSLSSPNSTIDPWLPTGARGDILLHSAGGDAVYLSAKDKKGNVFGNANTIGPNTFYELTYQRNFRDAGGTPLTSSFDQIGGFDDIVQAAN